MPLVSLRIKRFDPVRNEARYDSFQIDVDDGVNVLQALLRVLTEVDSALGIRFSCGDGMCGTCGLIINGRPRLACQTPLAEVTGGDDVVTLEPLGNFTPIKDLIVDMTPFWDRFKRVAPPLQHTPGKTRPFQPDAIQIEQMLKTTECIECGLCYSVCPSVVSEKFLGPAALARLYRYYADPTDTETLERLQPVIADPEAATLCTACGHCDDVCPKSIPIRQAIVELREEVVDGLGGKPSVAFEHLIGRNLSMRGNVFGENQRGRAAVVPEGIEYLKKAAEGEFAYFAGCGPCFNAPNVSENVMRIIDAAGAKVVYLAEDEWCCGLPTVMSGQRSIAKEMIEHNLIYLDKAGIHTVVTACGCCTWMLEDQYRRWARKLGLPWQVEVKHFAPVVYGWLREGRVKFSKPINARVTYHDPCRLALVCNVIDEPREILKAIPGIELVEMEHNRENGLCCGPPFTRMINMEVANAITKTRLDEAAAVKPDILISACTPCEFSFRVVGDLHQMGITVRDLTDLIAEAMGLEVDGAIADEIMLSRFRMMKGAIELIQLQEAQKGGS